MSSSRTYRTRAIVLDKTKLGESDLILELLAENGSLVRAVAKGARKPGSRLAARCELFCTVDALMARGRSLDIVSEAKLIAAPISGSASLERVSAASAAAEVLRLSSFEDSEDAFLFPFASKTLDSIAAARDASHLDLLVAACAFKALAHTGYRPDLSGCVLCGDERADLFSASAGGFLCASCAKSVAGATAVSPSEAGWLRALMALRFDELLAADIDAPTAAFLLALAHTWAATHLDARLRAFEFLLGV